MCPIGSPIAGSMIGVTSEHATPRGVKTPIVPIASQQLRDRSVHDPARTLLLEGAMFILAVWIKVELALRLSQLVPALPYHVAYTHADAAVEAAQPALPPELLLAIAYIESRFDATATSRVEGRVRQTGSYPSTQPPRALRGSLYCGPLQTYAASWSQCLAMREPARAYGAAARELAQWIRDPRVRGN